MLEVQVSSPTPENNSNQGGVQSLADLSRNASVISSSSDSSSTSDLTVHTPVRPRPIRTFSSPHRPMRSKSPGSPRTPRGSRAPAYLAREMGISEEENDKPSELKPPQMPAASQPRSRNSSVNGCISAQDFDFGRILGEGSYSTVMLARHRSTGKEYAIKVLDKGHLKRNNKLATALAEKNTLVRLGAGHPGIVHLHWTFQDEWSLFFVLDLARNGEIQSRISRLGSLSLACSRYYTAQLIDALEYMHNKGVIHRDLKPENLLLDDNFRLKLTDFGTGKILSSGVERSKTWVGTAQYISPELLDSSETSKSSDLWSLGCILFQMVSGRFAFQGLSEYLTWQKIKQLDYSFPEGFDEQAKDLVQKLLVRNPAERLGAGAPGSQNDMQALRAHPFLSTIDWKTLWTSPAPPLQPGMLKKDPQPPGGTGGVQTWDDVGAAWDDLVDGGRDEDEMSWASDDGPEGFKFGGVSTGENGMRILDDAVGPLGERRPLASFPPFSNRSESPEQNGRGTPRPRSTANGTTAKVKNDTNGTSDTLVESTSGVRFKEATKLGASPSRLTPQLVEEPPDSGTEADEDRDTVAATLDDIPTAVRTQAVDVPFVTNGIRDSYSTGSATSSSDGGSPPRAAIDATLNRGRNRAQTPIQGHGTLRDDEEWSSLLMPGETVIFNTTVEKSALRRRASRLLAIAGAPRRKPRELVLTDKRLICVKHKPGRTYQLSLEFFLKAHEGQKDSKAVITSVEAKGEKEFVVLTGSKAYPFLTSSSSMATMWLKKIRETLNNSNSMHSPSKGQLPLKQNSSSPAART
ncbi:kinase-like domain-containing protein [Irpex rosettiformis]|uniref:Kinase-like domain-containing protein n=1 Tax=Irpex rosettiformis TaxID=378272 RepID=A0ACB8UFD7_9APHY|nr:kinase-like domain-containing protein [Irpex rosettiformis]